MGDELKIVRDWLLKLPDLDLEDIVADGGVTSGMVVQQEAALMASKLSAILARAQGTGPGEAISDERAREFVEAAYAPPTPLARELMDKFKASYGPGEAVADGWVMVPREPSYRLISELASEWAYNIDEAAESYQGFLDVVERVGVLGSDPAAYEADKLADENGKFDALIAATPTREA